MRHLPALVAVAAALAICIPLKIWRDRRIGERAIADAPPCLSRPPPEAPAVAVYTTAPAEIEAMLRDRVHELERWSDAAWLECGQ